MNIKYFANVKIKEGKKILLEESNLFVTQGRSFIRDLLASAIVFDGTKYVVEFGGSTAIPSQVDEDLLLPLSPVVYTNSYDLTTVDDTELDLAFTFTNDTLSPVQLSELGLFYRPNGPDPGVGRVDKGYLIARLKTTYTSLVIGVGKTVTITWKIIF